MAPVAGAADAEHDDWMQERRHPPAALERIDAVAAAAKGRPIAVFLDYDGTLSPIVEDPDRAVRTDELKAEEGGKVVCLEAAAGAELYDSGLTTAPENADDGDMPARDNGVPVFALLPQLNDPGAFDYSKSPTDMLLGDEQGARRYYDVLLPQPEKASRGSCAPTYAVQVSVDAAAGAKTGDPIAVVGVKEEAGAEAGRGGHGGLSALVGVVASSSAATALAAGAAGPVTAFGLFALLVGGLSLAMASIHGD